MIEETHPVRLRPAARQDQPIIHQLISEGQINPFGVRWPHFIVAVDDGDQIVGCAQRKPHRGGVFELASVAVTARMQQQGIARQLILQVQAVHRQQTPQQPLWLMCGSKLEKLYTKFGFTTVHNRREMARYFGRISLLVNAFSQSPRLAIMIWHPTGPVATEDAGILSEQNQKHSPTKTQGA